MKLFLAPHNDDETLFGSFTIIRERPHVLVVYDSVVQQQRGINITAQLRRIESSKALLELIQDIPQFLGFHDTAIGTPEHLRVLLRAIGDALEGETPEHVWAPAIEQGGHEEHNLVGRIADELWPGKVTHYLTYRRGLGKSRSKNEVPFEPEWILRKLKALACYESQIVNREAGCWSWFCEDLREYTQSEYSFKFDKAKDTWVCSVHGYVDSIAWVPCWNGCNEGWFDDYEEDPIECEPGDVSMCRECRGEGGWRVCGECNINNPDAEF